MHLMKSKELEQFVVLTATEFSFVSMWNGQRNLFPQAKAIGIDVGWNHFYTDSSGETVPNPRYLGKSEKALKRLQKRVYRKKKGSSNRFKAINKLGRKHLKVSRQRKDFAIKTALCVVK
jgi:putative transposase